MCRPTKIPAFFLWLRLKTRGEAIVLLSLSLSKTRTQTLFNIRGVVLPVLYNQR